VPSAFLLVLHAHLPYVRPDGPEILEERWLYEAVAETYIPLLRTLERLQADGVPVRLAVSLSAPLLAMFSDRELMLRCRNHLDRVRQLAAQEAERQERTPLRPAAAFHRDHFASVVADLDRRGLDLVSGFRALAEAGLVELFTAAGTHGYLPLLSSDEARAAQIEAGLSEFERHFGRRPAGIWLPECAYAPGLDHLLAAAGIRWFIAESTTVASAWPPAGIPVVQTPGGVAAFARDPDAARQVWDASAGYPGDPLYREFYKDLGYELPLADVAHVLVEGWIRSDTGIKLWRVTGKTETKEPYDPAAAARRAAEHAAHFAALLGEQEGLVVAPFDAELFGHWWFEGPLWIEELFRAIAGGGGVAAMTPSDVLDAYGEPPIARLPGGSWGHGGDHRVWLSAENDWVWPALHAAEQQMQEVAASAEAPADQVEAAARELLLAEASDWPFIIHFGTTVEYAERRIRGHLERFKALLSGEPAPAAPLLFPAMHARAAYARRRPVPGEGPLRILMLSWEFPPNNVGGLGRHVADLGAALVRDGHIVHVVTLADPGSPPGTEETDGMTVHRVARPPEEGNFLVWVYRFNRAFVAAAESAAALSGPFDVVHSHDWLAGQAGVALKARWGCALVATIHATEKGRNGTIRLPIQQAVHEEEWLLAITADRVITVSKAMAREVAESFRVGAAVIYNGVTIPPPAGRAPHRFDAPYFFYIGRLVGEKGVHVAIRALSLMQRRAHCVVAGKGPLEEELKELARSLGLAGQVQFTGRISEAEKQAWLQNAAAGLVPSLYEPFGIVALEVMAAGVPVVVGDTGGLAEIVTHGVDGLKVIPGDAASLAAALDRLLAAPDEAGALAAAGRERAASRFGWESIAAETIAVYRRR
jgi:1,4-alpha-glucan branching enzyme